MAPLLCAGITTYSPLRHYGFDKPGFRLGVVGLGGLGESLSASVCKGAGCSTWPAVLQQAPRHECAVVPALRSRISQPACAAGHMAVLLGKKMGCGEPSSHTSSLLWFVVPAPACAAGRKYSLIDAVHSPQASCCCQTKVCFALTLAASADVTVISTSPNKKEAAIKNLGADHFLVSKDEKAMEVSRCSTS